MHANKLVEKANDAMERRAWDMAIELYLQAVTLSPDHLEARRGLRKAELKKFEAYYPSSVSRFVGTLGSRISSGIAKLTKNHEKRMIALERILRNDPKNVGAGRKLAAAAVAAGHRNAGIAACEGILAVKPEDVEALKEMGRLLYQTGQTAEALDAYERVLKIAPKDQDAGRMRKNLAAEVSITSSGLDKAKHSRELLRDQEAAKQLEQSDRLVRGDDELKDSVRTIEEKLAANPGDARLLAELGSRYAALKDYDRAIDAWDRAAEAEPQNFGFREKAGDLRILRFERDLKRAESVGDKASAERIRKEKLDFQIREYRARVAEHPTDLGLRFLLARELYAAGDIDGAMSEFQLTLKDPRRKTESLTMLGTCFMAKGMYDLAENQFQRALAETPGMSERTKEILYVLGELKEKQGDPEGALSEYKKIYEVDINFRDITERMAALTAKGE